MDATGTRHGAGDHEVAPVPPRSPGRFLVLVVALWVPLIVLGDAPLGLAVNLPVAGLATVCPLVAAVVLVAWREGRVALRRVLVAVLTMRGAARRPLATVVAVGVVPACTAVSAAVVALTGHRPAAGPVPIGSLPLLVVLFLLAAMAEEAGWTAYLLEPLHRRLGAVTAALVIGVVSAALHLWGWSAQTGHGLSFTVGMAVSTITLRVIAVHLWEITDRGPGTSVLLHASINVCSLPFAAWYDPVVVAVVSTPVALCCARRTRPRAAAGDLRRS